MFQYTIDSPKKEQNLKSFINWMHNMDSPLMKDILNLFTHEELEKYWNQRKNKIYIERTKSDVEIEAEVALKFLVF